MSVDCSIIVILGLLMPFPAVQSSSDIVSLATEFYTYSTTPHPPLAAYSVAKDDVVISTKGWVCISPPEDIICVLLCRQPENGEWWQQRGRKLLFLTPYQLSAPYCSHLLLSQTITRVALFTQPWHSISLPHPSTLLALSTGDPQQQMHELENADELTNINRSKLTVFQVKSTPDLMSWITIFMCRWKTKCVSKCSSVLCICFILKRIL